MQILFLSNLVGAFGDGLYAYVLPYYMVDKLNTSPVEIGLLYTTTSIFMAVTLLAGGFLADRFDRKKILILSWLIWAPAPFIFAIARNWTQMLPGMLLWGILFSHPASTAYIVTTVNRKKLTLTLTAISAAWSIGYTFSPALGGYLAQTINMQTVFFTASIFYLLAGIILFLIRRQVPARLMQPISEKKRSSVKLLKNRKLLIFSAFLGVTMFAILVFRPFLPTFLADVYGYKGFEIGVLGSFFFLGSGILGLVLGTVGDKYKKSYALAISLALTASSLILLLMFDDFRVLLVTHLLIGASYLAWPIMNSIVGSYAPETARARWVAIPQAVSMFGAVFAPYIGGLLYEASPYYTIIFGVTAAIVMALAALVKLRD